MQTPEKLALIGGSILVSTTMIFGLKGQASTLIPQVGHSISNVYNHIDDTQKDVEFDHNFQQAQKAGWTTGNWGTSKYYIGSQEDMHIGKGALQGGLNTLLGNLKASQIRSISLDQSVQAPQDSTGLFSTAPLYANNDSNLQSIEGLDRLDTSQMTGMLSMFGGDRNLHTLNGINTWDVSNVRSTAMAFHGASSLKSLDLSNWNLQNVHDASYMFGSDYSLESLNLKNFNTSNSNMEGFLGGTVYWSGTDNSLKNLNLGGQTRFNNIGYSSNGTWQNGPQSLNMQALFDGNTHPGTWVKQ